MDNREVRIAAKLTIDQAAVYSGVSSPTIRLFEANPDSPRADKRAVLAAYYEKLRADLASRPASPASTSPQHRTL